MLIIFILIFQHDPAAEELQDSENETKVNVRFQNTSSSQWVWCDEMVHKIIIFSQCDAVNDPVEDQQSESNNNTDGGSEIKLGSSASNEKGKKT